MLATFFTKVSVGDSIAAKVVMTENEDGYIELSLKEARQALIWADAEEAVKRGTVMSLLVKRKQTRRSHHWWQGYSRFPTSFTTFN